MRSIYLIANEIVSDWNNISPYASPYLDAMKQIDSIDENYYADSAKSVVLYFLSNANGWRGEKAREIKKELKLMCGI